MAASPIDVRRPYRDDRSCRRCAASGRQPGSPTRADLPAAGGAGHARYIEAPRRESVVSRWLLRGLRSMSDCVRPHLIRPSPPLWRAASPASRPMAARRRAGAAWDVAARDERERANLFEGRVGSEVAAAYLLAWSRHLTPAIDYGGSRLGANPGGAGRCAQQVVPAVRRTAGGPAADGGPKSAAPPL
jgi:hypothetical protein